MNLCPNCVTPWKCNGPHEVEGLHEHLTRIRERLRAAGAKFAANDNISQHIDADDLATIEACVAEECDRLLDALVIDRDHNTENTPKRMAKMFVRELFRGRYEAMPDLTTFPNSKQLDELYTVGPITVRSACSHHMVPIQGHAWIGVIPGERVIGLSKFNRLADWVLSRPQIQEEAVIQLADAVEAAVAPKGLAVVIRATHLCMTWRGVRENDTTMVTSVMRGAFRDNKAARDEVMSIINGQGY